MQFRLLCKKLVDWGYDRKDRILCECNGYVADENPWYDDPLQEGKNVGGCVSVGCSLSQRITIRKKSNTLNEMHTVGMS